MKIRNASGGFVEQPDWILARMKQVFITNQIVWRKAGIKCSMAVATPSDSLSSVI